MMPKDHTFLPKKPTKLCKNAARVDVVKFQHPGGPVAVCPHFTVIRDKKMKHRV